MTNIYSARVAAAESARPIENAPVLAGNGGASKAVSKHRKFNAKSTASEAQRQRILEALRRRPHTSYELIRMGCYYPPARIFELKRMGFIIEKTTVTVVDGDGFTHDGVALYALVAEPENADALIGGTA